MQDSRLPLHRACTRADPNVVAAVARLTARHPDSALAADSSGSVALHVACASPTPCEDLVRLLLDSDSEAASIIDEVGGRRCEGDGDVSVDVSGEGWGAHWEKLEAGVGCWLACSWRMKLHVGLCFVVEGGVVESPGCGH